jgi:mycofactocin precursor
VTTTPTTDTTEAEAAVVEGDVTGDDELVAEDEVLLEEISIDGMCGVY